MSIVFDKELAQLKKMILSEGTMVEESISRAIRALRERDEVLARVVIDADQRIDDMEIQVEEECLKILALYHPVANDLRFVVAALKINNDLERMGGLAKNIARRVVYLATHEKIDTGIDYSKMASLSQSMVKCAIDALVNRDAQLARQVCREDDALDGMREKANQRISTLLSENPDHVKSLLEYLAVARHLERLGDMAVSMAQDVIYLAEGEIVRHGGLNTTPTVESEI
jgi:phosphate transport system protein